MRKIPMKSLAILFLLSCACSPARPQSPVAGTARTSVTATCPSGKVIPAGTPVPDAYINDTQSYFCGSGGGTLPIAPANNMNQAIANAAAASILDLAGALLRGANKNDPAARAAAEAAAAAEQQRQAAIARQRALEGQKRQEMFDRLSKVLKGTGLATLSLKGFDNNVGLQPLQLKGFDSNSGLEPLKLKGFDNASANSTAATPQPTVTVPFGLGGNPCAASGVPTGNSNIVDLRDSAPGACLEAPTGDPDVVDLRDVQQGVDLAAVAANAPPSDQPAILDQALDAANGDKSVQIKMTSNTPVPVVSQDALRAFQQANAQYRAARDTRLQLEQLFNQAEQKRQMAYAIIKASEDQYENDLRNHIDDMTRAEKQESMARMFDAALQEHIAYGKTSAEYLAASARFDAERRIAQEELMKLAQTGMYDPSIVEKGPPDSDLHLLLPQPTATSVPTKDDLKFLAAIDSPGTPTDGPDLLKVAFDERIRSEELGHFPPVVIQKYKSDSSFQQQMNAEHQSVFGQRDQTCRAVVQESQQEFNQKIAALQHKGVVQPGVSIDEQEKANPQLHAQLQVVRKQIMSELDYKFTRAQWQANDQWQHWVDAQNAALTGKPAPIYVPAP